MSDTKAYKMKYSIGGSGCPLMRIFFTILAFCSSQSKASNWEDDLPSFNASLVRPNVYLRRDNTTTVPMIIACLRSNSTEGFVKVRMDNTKVATVSPSRVNVSCSKEPIKSVNLKVKGVFIGKTTLRINTYNKSIAELGEQSIPVVIMVKNRMLTGIFIVCVIFFMLLLNFGFGCKLEIDVIKEILKKPIPVLIGFLCQFTIMPLVNFQNYLLKQYL